MDTTVTFSIYYNDMIDRKEILTEAKARFAILNMAAAIACSEIIEQPEVTKCWLYLTNFCEANGISFVQIPEEKQPERHIIYTYDGVPIPLGGELFYRCRATKRFYILFSKTDLEPTRRKVYVGENEEMADTRETLNEIWEKYGEHDS